MVIGREDVRSSLKLTMISDGNENQFLIFLIFVYLIDPDFIRTRKIAQFQLVQNTVIRFLDLSVI